MASVAPIKAASDFGGFGYCLGAFAGTRLSCQNLGEHRHGSKRSCRFNAMCLAYTNIKHVSIHGRVCVCVCTCILT